MAKSTEEQSGFVTSVASLAAWYERELEGCRRAYVAGQTQFLHEVITLCERAQIPLPQWAADALKSVLKRFLEGGPPKRKGHSTVPMARIRQDMIHFERWDTVTMIRDKQLARLQEEKQFRHGGMSELEIAKIYRSDREIGRTWLDAYHLAAKDLELTPAGGSDDAMQRSYKLVERISRENVDQAALRFKLLSRQTYRELGLADLMDPPRRRRPSGS